MNARGAFTTYVYDGIGQVRTITNALGGIATFEYDAAGQLTVVYDPLGYRRTLLYDARGFLQVGIDPFGKRTTYTYTPTGRIESIQDPRAQRWTALYDGWDRVEARVNPLGSRATLIYDPDARVSALWDARGYRWTQLYDSRALPIETTDLLGRKSTLSYDATQRLVTFTDGKGQLATYSYSKRGELTGEIYADGTRITYTYDAVGQIRTIVDAAGWYTMTYNARGDKTSDQAPQHASGGILTHEYDEVGNRTLLHSWLGRQTMLYDLLDRCTLMFDTDSRRTTWLYDGLGRVTMQFNWNGTRTTWAYDPRGLIGLIRHTKSDGTLLEMASYTWDDAGNPLTRTTKDNKVTTWSYDEAGQLKTEWHSTGTIDTYTYDLAGNRTKEERKLASSLGIATLRYDAVGQLVTMLASTSGIPGTVLTTFVYDLNGNLQSSNSGPTAITTYTWDALNRLVGVIDPGLGGGRFTYTYRYDDLRSSRNRGSGVETLVWDVPGATGFGDLFEELDSTNSLLRAYFRATDLATQKDTSGSYAFHWIDDGTLQILTDLNQATALSVEYSAWGLPLGGSGTADTPVNWNGRWGYYRDGSRAWVRARHLELSRGRWLSQDPLGLEWELNPYAYVDNNPLMPGSFNSRQVG